MGSAVRNLERRLDCLEAQLDMPDRERARPGRPIEYVREVLGQDLWEAQLECCRKLVEPPHKVMAKACHGVGKTYLAGCLINWFFDSYLPSACITTAPTAREVRDLLWREVRLLRGEASGFRGHALPELLDAPDHYAKGFTAERGESFQGRHQEHMLFVFDEAVGVDAIFWETTKSMFDPGGKHFWFVIFNPTDTTSQAYAEELSGGWHVVTLAAPAHPNLLAELDHRPRPFPAAVSLQQFEMWLKDWFEKIPADEYQPTDLEWPPGSGEWYRPGPQGEARALGRWPSQGTYGVWSDAIWAVTLELNASPFDLSTLPEIGADTARYGDDYTAIHERWGVHSLHHERHNGWDVKRIAHRLKERCAELAERVNGLRANSARRVSPQEILVKIDGDGYGQDVVDLADGFNFVSVPASGATSKPDRYSNRRGEIWFQTVSRAKAGGVCLARLPAATQHLIRVQAMAQRWDLDSGGRQVVWSKEKLKKEFPAIGSPDDADAMNLAYYQAPGPEAAPAVEDRPSKIIPQPARDSASGRRGLFGVKGRPR